MSPRELFTASNAEIETLETAIVAAAKRMQARGPIEYIAVETAVLQVARSGQAYVDGSLDPQCLAAAACQYLIDIQSEVSPRNRSESVN